MADATIHLRVPATTKARWVRQSRAEGKRLTDWIIERVEGNIMQTIAQQILATGEAAYQSVLAKDSNNISAASAAKAEAVSDEIAKVDSTMELTGLFADAEVYTFADGSKIMLDGTATEYTDE